MGELFNNPNEWLSLVTGRLIDFIRIHISQVGGLSMARKVAALCIQEARVFTQAEQDVFPGCPELKSGYYYANDKPGLGIDLDEKLAARFPIEDDPSFDMRWGNLRRRDGTVTKP
jgi:mannonate dehydratase